MKRRILAVLLLIAAVLLLALAFLFRPGKDPAVVSTSVPVPTIQAPEPTACVTAACPLPEPTQSDPAHLEEDSLPHDKLFITVERQKYEDGSLQLAIPKLEVDVPVLNGVDAQTLLRGVGLYDYAQLPGEGNRNVSIAGHRNGLRNGQITDGMPFYYIDTLEEGDCLYLTDSTHIYQYVWDETTVVEPDDWGPIYSQGFSCITLTSCTPIGVSDHRIIVRGRLVEIIDRTDDYDYPSQIKEEPVHETGKQPTD